MNYENNYQKILNYFFIVFNVITLNAQFIEINKNINKMEVLSARSDL